MTSEIKQTNRGFDYKNFTDANQKSCSIQISSACRDESLIWLGCNEIGLQKFEPKNGGWKKIDLEDEEVDGVCYIANNRMHLSQSQVKDLLPTLQHFAETGELI